jgi:hypothetical protein
MRTIRVLFPALVALAPTYALADEALEGPGVAVSPGTVLHPNIGAEAGVINNVFFEDTDAITSGLFRISAKLDLASAKAPEPETDPEILGEDPPAEPAAPAFEFRLGGVAAYEEYLYYGNPSTTAQRNLTLDAVGHLLVYPQGTWAFVADDRLRRDVRPRNFEDATSTNRIDNLLNLGIRYQPGGRAISGTLRYQNALDVYEGSTAVANRMNQLLAVKGEWQWRPYTRFTAELSYGFYGPLGDAAPSGALTKYASNPLTFITSVATVLSEPVTLKAHLGWAWSPYEMGQGYNAPLAGTELGFMYAPTGRLVLEADYYFQDSTNANFYRDIKLQARVEQQVRKLLFSGGLAAYIRGYRGINGIGAPNRDDVVLSATARAQYVLSERYYATAEYIGTADQTDYVTTFMGTDDPSYSRHELMVGVRAAF